MRPTRHLGIAEPKYGALRAKGGILFFAGHAMNGMSSSSVYGPTRIIVYDTKAGDDSSHQVRLCTDVAKKKPSVQMSSTSFTCRD